MTFPGNATTGSTLLNDAAAWFDAIVAGVLVLGYLCALITPAIVAICAIVSDLRKP